MVNKFFLYIIEKYFDFSSSFVPFNIYNGTKNSGQRYLYKRFFNKETYNYNKFKFYMDTLKNTFMTEIMKNEFIDNFNKIQRVYHILNKLAFTYKYKKSKIIVDNDLCLNKLEINHNLTFCLYQGNNKYLFNINEIVKLITTGLINSPLFFSEPIVSKNPYNNIPFNKSTLYNIYFTLQNKNIKTHELFEKFFLQNFDLTNFKKYNEHLIREYAIDNHIKNSTDDLIYNVILNMLTEYNKLVYKNDRFKFCFNFPRDKIILAMKPFVNVYYRSKYSLITTVKSNSTKYLFVNLLKFKKINMCFGRKIYKVETKYINFVKKTTAVMYYYDTFININLNNQNFLNSHLLCDEDNTDIALLANTLYNNNNDDDTDYNEISYNQYLYYPIQENENSHNNEPTYLSNETEDENINENINENMDMDTDEDTDEDENMNMDIDEYIDEEEDIDEECNDE